MWAELPAWAQWVIAGLVLTVTYFCYWSLSVAASMKMPTPPDENAPNWHTAWYDWERDHDGR